MTLMIRTAQVIMRGNNDSLTQASRDLLEEIIESANTEGVIHAKSSPIRHDCHR